MRYMDCENIFNTKKKDTWLITFPSIIELFHKKQTNRGS